MLQVYLLSVMANLVGGLVLLAPRSKSEEVQKLTQQPAVRITIGIIATLVGLAKFVLRAPGDTVVVVGDFLPAIAGLATGLLLLGDVYANRENAAAPAGWFRANGALLRVPVGVAGVAVAVVHFLFPAIALL